MPSIPCPSCGAPFPPSSTRCPSCDLPLTGPAAARLWQVDQAIAALHRERTDLLVTLRASAAAPPAAPATAGPTADTTPTQAATAPRRTWTTQQTLLAVGVLLVLVAGSIALAIAWFTIGRWGQVALMGVLTALACWVSLLVSRRGLPSTAEAVAVVAGGLLLLDVAAARRFGLAGLDAVDGRTYAALSGLLVAVALAALHTRDRRIAAYALLSLTAASAAWAAVTTYADTPASAAALCLTGAALFGALSQLLPSSLGLVRRAATGPAAGWTVLGALAATVGGAIGVVDDPTATSFASVALLALTGVASAVVVRHVVTARAERLGSRDAARADWAARWTSGDWRAVTVVAIVASVTSPLAVLLFLLQLSPYAATAVAVLTIAGALGVVGARPLGTGAGGLWADAQAGLAVAAALVAVVALDSQPALALVLAAAAVAAAATAVLRPDWRAPASGLAAAAFLLAAGLAADLSSDTATALTLALASAALAALALARPGRPEEAPVGAVAALGLAAALAITIGEGLGRPVLAAVLVAVTSVAATTTALRPRLRLPALAVAVGSGVWLARVLGLLVSVELGWAAVALAVLVLAAAAAWRRAHPDETLLGVLAVLAAIPALGLSLEHGWVHATTGACAAYALAATAYAALPQRRPVVTVAVVTATGGLWLELLDAGVTTLEAYTLPLAAALAAAGLWSRDLLARRSWPVAGPALAVALLPSALLAAVDDGVLRPLLVVTAAVAVLVTGAQRRWQALVVLGATAAVVVAVTQLGPYAVQLPRYLTLGTLGVLLLAVGARYEQRRADAKQAVSWLASMS